MRHGFRSIRASSHALSELRLTLGRRGIGCRATTGAAGVSVTLGTGRSRDPRRPRIHKGGIMRGTLRLAALAACAVGFVALPATAAADHGTRPHTQNMHALGHSPDFGSFLLPDGQRDANSDLAFRGITFAHATRLAPALH